MDRWTLVKWLYKHKFGYPPIIVDYIAVKDILKMCCMGCSNYRISSRTDQSEEYVVSTLLSFLGFSGWYTDLQYSPLAIYNKCIDLDKFRGEVYTIDAFANDEYINTSFKLCKRYDKIRKEIDKYER